MIDKIREYYGKDFKNGEYSNGNPCLYKLVFFDVVNGDDFAVFEHCGRVCVGHLVNFDFEKMACHWAWGHYDFKDVETAKNFITHFFDK